jgi:hypothetical protein
MKIRNGFVSNSSSSSFVFMGFALPNNVSNERMEVLVKEQMLWRDQDDVKWVGMSFIDDLCSTLKNVDDRFEYGRGKIILEANDLGVSREDITVEMFCSVDQSEFGLINTIEELYNMEVWLDG